MQRIRTLEAKEAAMRRKTDDLTKRLKHSKHSDKSGRQRKRQRRHSPERSDSSQSSMSSEEDDEELEDGKTGGEGRSEDLNEAKVLARCVGKHYSMCFCLFLPASIESVSTLLADRSKAHEFNPKARFVADDELLLLKLALDLDMAILDEHRLNGDINRKWFPTQVSASTSTFD
jgi:hypothetical protein